jgi:hypothetical protein
VIDVVPEAWTGHLLLLSRLTLSTFCPMERNGWLAFSSQWSCKRIVSVTTLGTHQITWCHECVPLTCQRIELTSTLQDKTFEHHCSQLSVQCDLIWATEKPMLPQGTSNWHSWSMLQGIGMKQDHRRCKKWDDDYTTLCHKSSDWLTCSVWYLSDLEDNWWDESIASKEWKSDKQ